MSESYYYYCCDNYGTHRQSCVRHAAVQEKKLMSNIPRYQGCNVPPTGWWCSREPNHEGPCAARPLNELPDSEADPIDVNRTAENLGKTRRDLQP